MVSLSPRYVTTTTHAFLPCSWFSSRVTVRFHQKIPAICHFDALAACQLVLPPGKTRTAPTRQDEWRDGQRWREEPSTSTSSGSSCLERTSKVVVRLPIESLTEPGEPFGETGGDESRTTLQLFSASGKPLFWGNDPFALGKTSGNTVTPPPHHHAHRAAARLTTYPMSKFFLAASSNPG